jgi:predicted SAM-dependent methyltransferase
MIDSGAVYVNVGCGSRYHPDWLNFDMVPAGPGVVACDLTKGIPVADNSCDAIYHSHVLEHIRRADVPAFMRECLRVLKPGGIMRTVVPDLEQAASSYLDTLHAALDGDQSAAADHEWMVIELLDQLVRERGGGSMLDYLSQDHLPNEAFIYERHGEDARNLVGLIRRQKEAAQQGRKGPAESSSGSSGYLRRARRLMRRFFSGTGKSLSPEDMLSAEDRRALAIGRFRLAGEVHQWMYDRYSLDRLLLDSGFTNPVQQTPTGSQIPAWESYHLDTTPEGKVYKPESLYMESAKSTR